MQTESIIKLLKLHIENNILYLLACTNTPACTEQEGGKERSLSAPTHKLCTHYDGGAPACVSYAHTYTYGYAIRRELVDEDEGSDSILQSDSSLPVDCSHSPEQSGSGN